MKELEIVFTMKNNNQIIAKMEGNKVDVISEINYVGFNGAKSFGNHVVNMNEVLAVEVIEGHDVPGHSTAEKIDPKNIFTRGY
ncbi:hypothetical protein F8160_00085 [Bacillus sp. CH126_4D]|uniref:hypothetical protein n=1 Tax=unclassified Bacillus (in: firmicutes) TaxID=185979 RepID=UPI00124D8A76|nr:MULTISPECIES: hypothetical protein [unclassified Bacillus (in: firmicutes)]KAB2460771.1 hypothetical protein F8162_00750 [Bacillus sp. CH140a_4T]KAB2476415.1 hypothetical protein F8160_00085 [Bacillus sp. CH126_4D]